MLILSQRCLVWARLIQWITDGLPKSTMTVAQEV